MPRDRKKGVLVTGAGSGIGRALAVKAALDGMQVAVCGRRLECLLETRDLLRTSERHLVITGDVTSAFDRSRIVARIASQWGSLDVLVNNAGVIEAGTVADMHDDALRRVFETNVIAPIALARDLRPMLSVARGSRVVNIGSVFGDIPFPMLAAYSASKFALRGFSTALRREWKNEGIGVTYVAPRATLTAALAKLEATLPKAGLRADSPEAVAARVWRSIASGADNVHAPGVERLYILIQRVFPRLIDMALAGQSPPRASRAN